MTDSRRKLDEKNAVIFDLDGTLLDSMGIWHEIDLKFLGDRGIEMPVDYQQIITPMGPREAAEYTVSFFNLSDTPEELMEEWHQMSYEAYANYLPLKPGAYEYVKSLYDRGITMGVATSSDIKIVIPALERTGLLPMMKAIVTRAEVEHGKGHPEIYDKACDQMGVKPEECAVFEDILEGLTGAHMGNYMAVAIYDSQCKASPEEMKAEADLYIQDFTDLLNEEQKARALAEDQEARAFAEEYKKQPKAVKSKKETGSEEKNSGKEGA